MPDPAKTSVALEAYFDEAGFTGNDLAHPEQRNLLFAGIVIPAELERSFWDQAIGAWRLAGEMLGSTSGGVELKGSELYGGKEHFEGVPLEERCKILETIFAAVETHRVLVMWDGASKREWQEALSQHGMSSKDHPIFKSFLIAYCEQLYELLSGLFPEDLFHVIGDENNWIRAGRLLTIAENPTRWSRMLHGGVQFCRSTNTHGLQVADILAHTLYRANKDQMVSSETTPLSNTDKIATSFTIDLNGLSYGST